MLKGALPSGLPAESCQPGARGAVYTAEESGPEESGPGRCLPSGTWFCTRVTMPVPGPQPLPDAQVLTPVPSCPSWSLTSQRAGLKADHRQRARSERDGAGLREGGHQQPAREPLGGALAPGVHLLDTVRRGRLEERTITSKRLNVDTKFTLNSAFTVAGFPTEGEHPAAPPRGFDVSWEPVWKEACAIGTVFNGRLFAVGLVTVLFTCLINQVV